MTYSTIKKSNPVITMINVFAVEPEKQQEFLDAMRVHTDTVIRKIPGFIASNFHRSLDGMRVVNYSQWESKEAFEAVHRDPEYLASREANKHLIISTDQHLYTVEFTCLIDGIPQD